MRVILILVLGWLLIFSVERIIMEKDREVNRVLRMWDKINYTYDSLQQVPTEKRDSLWYAKKAEYFHIGDSLRNLPLYEE